jgi:hypothetical protein
MCDCTTKDTTEAAKQCDADLLQKAYFFGVSDFAEGTTCASQRHQRDIAADICACCGLDQQEGVDYDFFCQQSDK